ncbi:MAG TPA: HD-GYP domain-containing protein [Actinomycetota bacterium]
MAIGERKAEAPADLDARRAIRATPALPHLQDEDLRAQLLSFARDLNRIYHEERARSEELQTALHELEDSYFQMIKAFAFLVEARDPNTRSHLSRAHDYAVALARRIAPNLADDRIFRYGFLLHDIGKMGIPDHILGKPSPLTHEEWQVMQTHPLLGGQILAPIKYLERAIPIVECHHERWDGQGYPRGLAREDIPIAARIFSVVDTFDAMTSDRPYRRALSVEEAVAEIRKAGGTQLDPAVADGFAALCEERTQAWPLKDPGYPTPD